MKFIKKYKGAIIALVIVVLLILLATFTVYRMFNPNDSKDIYGERLENAPSIDTAVIEKIKDEITKTELVDSVEYKTNVKIMKFYIKVKNDTKKDSVLKLTDHIVNNLSSDVTNYYDMEVYFMNDTMTEYPIIAYLAKGGTEFKYTVNKEGEVNE